MPPLGWDAEHPKPELDWRRKKEIIGGALHNEGAPLPACYEFLRPTPIAHLPQPKPEQRSQRDTFVNDQRQRANGAARNRRWHARKRAGRSVYRLELDSAGLEDLLIAATLLEVPAADDHHAVESALAKLIEVMVADHLRSG